jgi:hypothetical protein
MDVLVAWCQPPACTLPPVALRQDGPGGGKPPKPCQRHRLGWIEFSQIGAPCFPKIRFPRIPTAAVTHRDNCAWASESRPCLPSPDSGSLLSDTSLCATTGGSSCGGEARSAGSTQPADARASPAPIGTLAGIEDIGEGKQVASAQPSAVAGGCPTCTGAPSAVFSTTSALASAKATIAGVLSEGEGWRRRSLPAHWHWQWPSRQLQPQVQRLAANGW